MGGTGGGERSYSRSRTSQYHEIDARRWQRAGLLVAGNAFMDRMFKVNVSPLWDPDCKPDHAIVSSGARIETMLPIGWTRCNTVDTEFGSTVPPEIAEGK